MRQRPISERWALPLVRRHCQSSDRVGQPPWSTCPSSIDTWGWCRASSQEARGATSPWCHISEAVRRPSLGPADDAPNTPSRRYCGERTLTSHLRQCPWCPPERGCSSCRAPLSARKTSILQLMFYVNSYQNLVLVDFHWSLDFWHFLQLSRHVRLCPCSASGGQFGSHFTINWLFVFF